MAKYSNLKTISDYNVDEVISALQKEIRRGNFENASFFALELLASNLEDKLWERLIVIVVEDVADHNSITQIHSLKQAYYDLEKAKIWDKNMQVIKAVQILCEAKKDRIVSELYDYLKIKRKKGYKIPIPDYAIDMHTKKGKELGRDYKHFLEVSSKITNTKENKNREYFDYLIKNS